MWISYTDSEVNTFHPICQKALENALAQLGKKDEYTILHHQYTGSLEMDFAIQNKNTGKYLCVVEVKRTPNDVQSVRYQFQAMSYVQMNSEVNEQPFYILTNLETAYAFRYDASKPKSFQQMICPGLVKIGKFSDFSEKDFIKKLSDYFKIMLSNFIENKYNYLVTLEQFANIIENIKNAPQKWKTNLAYLLYEYIRGAFTFIRREDLHDIRLFNKNISKICEEASKINFKGIFNYSNETFDNKIDIENKIDDLKRKDEAKTRIMKYITYKKRTEQEVRKKFKGQIEEQMLEEIIEYLKEAKYIDDEDYIKRAVNNFKLLKKMSITEVKYKLQTKGINRNLIEDYIYKNKEELTEYEINSAEKIIMKKDQEKIEITSYLIKKGYKKDNINKAYERIQKGK